MMAERGKVAAAFDMARDYEGQARIQHAVAQALAARIGALDLPEHPRLLEIGCGTGFLTRALEAQGLGGGWLVTDLSAAMVARCEAGVGDPSNKRFAVLDGERDEPDGGPFDLICSSFALQWFIDAPAALARMQRWLAPGGHLVVATLGAGTFAEWRAAHEALGLSAGTPPFPPAEAFSALMPETLTVSHHRESHADGASFLRAVKAIGAGTARSGHRPLSPAQLRAVMRQFESNASAVTYEVVTLHLRSTAGSPP